MKKEVDAGKLNLEELQAEQKRIEAQQKDDITTIKANQKNGLKTEEKTEEALAAIENEQLAHNSSLKALEKEMSTAEHDDNAFKHDDAKLLAQLKREFAATQAHSRSLDNLNNEYW